MHVKTGDRHLELVSRVTSTVPELLDEHDLKKNTGAGNHIPVKSENDLNNV